MQKAHTCKRMREKSPEHNTSKGKNVVSKRHLTYSNDWEKVKIIAGASVLLTHTGAGEAGCECLLHTANESLFPKSSTCSTNTQSEYIRRDKDSEGKSPVKNTMQPRNTHTSFPSPGKTIDLKNTFWTCKLYKWWAFNATSQIHVVNIHSTKGNSNK